MKTGKIKIIIGKKWWLKPVCMAAVVMFHIRAFPPSKISAFAAFIARHGTTTKVAAE